MDLLFIFGCTALENLFAIWENPQNLYATRVCIYCMRCKIYRENQHGENCYLIVYSIFLIFSCSNNFVEKCAYSHLNVFREFFSSFLRFLLVISYAHFFDQAYARLPENTLTYELLSLSEYLTLILLHKFIYFD